MTGSRRSESDWIRTIQALWGSARVDVGIGDDSCVLPAGRYAVTTDTLVEGVDFQRDWAPPQALGYKAMASNLSDLAAMGADPEAFLLTMAIPESVKEEYVEGILSGMYALSSREGLAPCGGDLSSSPSHLVLGLTLIGRQDHMPLLRSGGAPGQVLFLSGPLGAPAAALARFKAGGRLRVFPVEAPVTQGEQALLDRFYRPPSQTALGLYLARTGLASACMDISDGLGRDLGRLCEASGCGAEVDADLLPLDPLLKGLPPKEALAAALRGGEEQVLLVAVENERVAEMEEAPVELTRIGRLTGSPHRIVLGTDGCHERLDEGFDHFLS